MTFKWRSFLILVASVSILACAEKSIKLDPMVTSRLSTQKEIVAIHYLPEPFVAQTPEVRNAGNAGMMFGAVGGAIAGAAQASAAKETGSQIISDYSLEDPILRIKKTFLDFLASGAYATSVRQEQRALSTDDIAQLKKTFSSGFVFDFKTTGWLLGPAGMMSQDNYNVRYEGRARLLSFPRGET